MSEIYKNRHSAYNLHVHLVFITKYRKKVLADNHLQYFKEVVAEICKDFGAELKECNGEGDHVHMLIQYPPTVQLSKMVNNLKSVTSRRMRANFIDLRAAYNKPVLWSRSYFAGSCGGAPLEIIKQYIQNQQS
ncbi:MULTISPECIES: IS200/IS605 family transposase [Psychrobacter]|jgi:putative transposase|uniref:IS200/IS605 family transposase n=2 Tax=Psychrobacter TaxID=497 RepID=A0ABT9HII7_9GAMM|nr:MULTISPECIES: IS200/IS605 family transposase [Psychrobacter]MDN6275548.1 IS200/IS605 family transposase [Psychrobacter sp.]MDP4545462.1 IS200/IS605 family transposase [Psychrobacter faecalis]PKG92833.1 IS200/IS605 family transposase [Psychrobacter sp. Sarcosine-02u-2]WLW67573.1 IS200/IS605 family transposase [Psychrobacter sp. van23A]